MNTHSILVDTGTKAAVRLPSDQPTAQNGTDDGIAPLSQRCRVDDRKHDDDADAWGRQSSPVATNGNDLVFSAWALPHDKPMSRKPHERNDSDEQHENHESHDRHERNERHDDEPDVIEIKPGIFMANRPEEERIKKFTLTPEDPSHVERNDRKGGR